MKTFFLKTACLLLLLFSMTNCNNDEQPTNPPLTDLRFVVEEKIFAYFEKNEKPNPSGLCMQTDLLDPTTKNLVGLLSACVQSSVEIGDVFILDMTLFFTLDDGEIEGHLIMEAKPDEKDPQVYVLSNRPEVSPNVILSGSGDYIDAKGNITVNGRLEEKILKFWIYLRTSVLISKINRQFL